ncbi:hypothetical protein PLICRDRAFT_214043 [Plicaturopsis crispa FD-325 SS-3]|nr:hypothetical protein PLICRDRAFT_214043 [Plicaturopsis crispa FD-325 SS-3]
MCRQKLELLLCSIWPLVACSLHPTGIRALLLFLSLGQLPTRERWTRVIAMSSPSAEAMRFAGSQCQTRLINQRSSAASSTVSCAYLHVPKPFEVSFHSIRGYLIADYTGPRVQVIPALM